MPQAEDAMVIEVWVVPGASRSEVVGPHGDALKVRVAAPAEAGKANAAVCELIRDHFGAASAEIAAGATSRRKRLRVVGATRVPGTNG